MENLVEKLKLVYSGKRVLVTGHNGFKGSWLVALLKSLGAEVHGISLEIKPDSPFKEIHDQICDASYTLDIRSFALLKSQIGKIKPDLVFHLAAQSLVLDSYEKPRETFEVNIQGTVNLLDSVINTTCLGVVAATTDKVYKNDNLGMVFKESDELWGYDPYSLSKTGAEIAMDAWRNIPSYTNCGLVTARAGNVFGPGDRAKNRLIPDLMHSIRSHSVAEIRNPSSVRPWQYVLDPLLGYLLIGFRILKNEEVKNAYNFGPSQESFLSVMEVVEKLHEIEHFEFSIAKQQMDLESTNLKLDSTLAENELGWCSATPLMTGLQFTVLMDHPQISARKCLEHVEEYLISAQNSMMKRIHN